MRHNRILRTMRTLLSSTLALLLLFAGVQWEPATVSAAESESVSIALGADPVASGITARAGDAGEGLVTGELDGKTYWQTNRSLDDESKRIIYFYMDVDDSFAANIADYDVQVSVEYYDADSGKINLQYDAQGEDKSFKDGPLFQYGDSGSWQTHTFELSDANFANRTGGGDFRIGIEGGGASYQTTPDLKVASVTVTKTPKPMQADEVGVTLGETPLEQGIVARAGDNPDGLVTGTLGGKGYWQTNRAAADPRTLYFYMNVDNGFLYDVQDEDVYVTVEYLDQGSGTFLLQYDALSAAFKDGPLFAYGNTGEWKTKTFKLGDAKFADRANGADFRIAVSGGGNNEETNPDLSIASVTVKKAPRLATDTQAKVYATDNPTDDVVIADYSVADFGAQGDGVADDTAAFQGALDAARANGGGVVFAPAGHYRIDGALTVPTGVTLRGDWASPETSGGETRGTILDAYGGRGGEDGPSFLQLEPVSGVTNLSVWYPEQSLDDPAPYPWTIEQLSGDSATMENLTLVNSYNGIKIGPAWNELHYVKNVYGTALHTGIFLDYTTDIGRLEGVHLSPSFWSGSGLAGAPDAVALHGYTTTQAEGIVMGRSDWEYMSDIRIDGFRNGMRVTTRTGSAETANAQLYGIHIEDCNVALKIEGVNDFGLLVSNSSFKAGVGESPRAIYATEGFHSIVQFNTVTIGGSPDTAVYSEGSGVLSFENSSFESWNDAAGGYAIELRGGSLTLGGTTFAKAEKQVKLSGAVQTVNAINSGLNGELAVTDESDGAEVYVSQDDRYALEPLPAVASTDIAVRPKPATSELFDVSAAPYSADRNGNADASAAIQQALDAAAAAGGGTVYLPAGIYRVDSPLTVPGGVELRGSWDVPHHTIGGGTALFTRYGENPEANTPALITLEASAGVRGLSVYYDEQDWNNVKPYAWTIQGKGHGVYAIDTTLINSYQGLDFGTYDTSGHYIDYVAGSPLKEGVFVGGGAEGGFVRNVQFNPHYYGRNNYVNHPSTDADFNQVWNYQKENLDAFRVGAARGETIFNTFVYGSQYGIHFASQDAGGPEAVVIGHGTDGSKKGVYIEGAGAAGLSFVNTELVSLSTTDKVYITAADGFDSAARFYNTSMWGDTTRSVDVYDGTVRLQQSNFTTVGEKGVNALGGDVALYDSYFQQPRTTHVYAGPDIEKLVVTNNLFKGGMQLVNEAGVKVSGTNLVPIALGLEKSALDPAHPEQSNAALTITNATDPGELSGSVELVQPASYAAKLVPVRFAGLAYGESVAIDLPYIGSDSLKYKVTLADGRTYLASAKLAQSFAGRAVEADSAGGDAGGSGANGGDAGVGATDVPAIDVSSLDEYSGGGWQGADDLSASARLSWDDEKLYVNVDVKDDVQSQTYSGVDIWQGDSIQLGIDLSRQDGTASKNVSELGFALKDDGSIVKWRWKAPEGLATGDLGEAADATITRDEDGGATRYAIAIPFASLHAAGYAFDPQAHALGFSLLMNENDGSGREGFMEYNQGIGNSKDFTLYGDLYLLGGAYADLSVPAAQAAVERAETAKDDASVDAARNFVALLADGGTKTSLNARLDAIGGSGGGGGGASGASGEPFTLDNGVAVVKPAGALDAGSGLIRAKVDATTLNRAFAAADAKRVSIALTAQQTAPGYAVELPKAFLAAASGAGRSIELVTPKGTLVVSGAMFDAALNGLEDTVTFVIRDADRDGWSDEAKAAIGDRPAVSLMIESGGKSVEWSNAKAPAEAAIPYRPSAEEAANPGGLTVRYVDGEGKIHSVSDARYDASQGRMTFRTTHFSDFAVAYSANATAFADLDRAPWAREAVEALAAKGIVAGLGDGSFGPGLPVSRADFLLLLVRTLGLTASADSPAPSFIDVPAGAYYEEAARIASALGIAGGVGGGRFDPAATITRQDAAAMLERALRLQGAELPAGRPDALAAFADAGDAAPYAASGLAALADAGLLRGSGGKLHPRGELTRAEAAVLLYRIDMR